MKYGVNAYDLAGNRTQMTANGVSYRYTLGTGDRLASWGANAENTIQYDTAGNVTNMAFGDGRTVSLAWNTRYQVTESRTNGIVVERHGYDALGRRAWTWDGTATNFFVYDGIHVLADVDRTGGVRRSYLWGPGIDNLLAMTIHDGPGAPRTVYPIKDHLGTVHAFADGNGALVERYEYDAWGRVLAVYDSSGQPSMVNGLWSSSLGNRYLFQGREYSWSTGLYFFRARWYDPMTGRWLSNDPIGISGGLNQSVFCADDPVNFMDPDGLRWVDVYVWRWRRLGVLGGRVGHVMVTEHNSEKIISSPFPSPRGRHEHMYNKPYGLTYIAEGDDAPDDLFEVFVPDDAAFNSEARKQNKMTTWDWLPDVCKSETHCARAAYNMLKAGGVPVSGQDQGQIFPNTLGNILRNLAHQQQGASPNNWQVDVVP
jgi:RHS repeat-associated protein